MSTKFLKNPPGVRGVHAHLGNGVPVGRVVPHASLLGKHQMSGHSSGSWQHRKLGISVYGHKLDGNFGKFNQSAG